MVFLAAPDFPQDVNSAVRGVRQELNDALIVRDPFDRRLYDWDAFIEVWNRLLSQEDGFDFLRRVINYREMLPAGEGETLFEMVCCCGSTSETWKYSQREGLVAPSELFEQMLVIAPEAASLVHPRDRSSALMICASNSQVCPVLMKSLIDLDSNKIALRTFSWATQNYPIHQAILNGRMDVVEDILLADMDYQVRVQDKTKEGNTVLHLALNQCNSSDFVESIIELAPQAARAKNRAGDLPFHVALRNFYAKALNDESYSEVAQERRTKVVDLLLKVFPDALQQPEPKSGLAPWMMVASGDLAPPDLDMTYKLLRLAPDTVTLIDKPDLTSELEYEREQERLRNPFGLTSCLKDLFEDNSTLFRTSDSFW